MPTLTCASCAHDFSMNPGDRTPPWCPKCGSDLRAQAGGARPAPSAPAEAGPPRALSTAAFLAPTPAVAEKPKQLGECDTGYVATVSLRCWKQHTCAACGGVYRYRFERSAQAEGRHTDTAAANAEQALVKKLTTSVDTRPCPTCGLVQPDMAAWYKIVGHAGLAVGALLALALVAIPAHFDGIRLDLAGQILAGIVGVVGVAHLLLALVNHNADRQGNIEKAQAAVEAGDVVVDKPGDTTDLREPPSNLGLVHGLALLGVLAAPVALLAPYFASPAEGWPFNTPRHWGSDVSPRLTAPGDQVYVPLPDNGVRTVKGLWQGTPRVEVLNAADVGCGPTLTATGSTSSWENGIWAKSSEKSRSPGFFARFNLPGGAALEGKSLRVRVTLTATYPTLMGTREFIDQTTTVVREVAIKAAPAAVKQTYWSSWGAGVVLGLVGTLAGGLTLVWLGVQLRNTAEPSAVVPVESNLDKLGQAA